MGVFFQNNLGNIQYNVSDVSNDKYTIFHYEP